MNRYGWATTGIYVTVAERHRGEDDPKVYLRKIQRTLDDMLAGRPVRPWRLERAVRFFSDVADAARSASYRPTRCW